MTHLNAEEQAVLAKVEKLLALAKGNANENEAASATAKAMELLAAYNLDMAVIGNTGKGSQRKDTRLKGGLYAWQRDIWKAVSELNFCMYWSIKGLTKGSTYEHRILGRQVNVASAQAMADYLQQAVERLTREYAKANHYHSIFVRELIAYREGMAHRLVDRLNTLRKQRLAEDERKQREERARSSHPGAAPASNALVLASVIHTEEDLNNDYLYGKEPGWHSEQRAIREARQAAALAAYHKQMEEKQAWRLANPEAAKAQDEADRKANAEWLAKYEKRNARRKEPVYRERALTAQEQRARLSTFTQGYYKADEIGLDDQVTDLSAKNRIGGR